MFASAPLLRAGFLLVGAAAPLCVLPPRVASDASLGPWVFVVEAAGDAAFREVYPHRSRTSCEAERAAMARGFARVAAERGGAEVAAMARRVHIGPCVEVRRTR